MLSKVEGEVISPKNTRVTLPEEEKWMLGRQKQTTWWLACHLTNRAWPSLNLCNVQSIFFNANSKKRHCLRYWRYNNRESSRSLGFGGGKRQYKKTDGCTSVKASFIGAEEVAMEITAGQQQLVLRLEVTFQRRDHLCWDPWGMVGANQIKGGTPLSLCPQVAWPYL